MPLRLAGEDYAVVQGLDGLGRLRTIAVSDASPGLKVNQQGSGTLLELQAAGASRLALANGGRLDLPAQGSGGGLLLGGDVLLFRGAADVLRIPDTIQLSPDGGTNGVQLDYSGGVGYLRAVGSHNLILRAAGGQVQFESTGNKRAQFDAITGDLSLGTQKLLFGTFGSEDVNLYRYGPNLLATDDGLLVGGLTVLSASGYMDFNEIAAPASPGGNTARLYARDNGSGKTQVCVLFNTGVAQVLATEP